MFEPSSNEFTGHDNASETDPVVKLAAELQEMHGKASVISRLWTAAEQQGQSLDWLRTEDEEIGARLVTLEDEILSTPAVSTAGATVKFQVARSVAEGGFYPLLDPAILQAVDVLAQSADA